MRPTTPSAPPFMLETPFGKVRSLRPGDVSDALLGWYADPDVMAPVNMKPRTISKKDMRAYVAGFDNRTKMILGLFGHGDIGLFALVILEIDAASKVARLNLLLGKTDTGALRCLAGGTPLLFEALLRKRGLEKLTAQVTEGNETVGALLARAGMQKEGVLRGQILSRTQRSNEKGGPRRLDQTLYGLLASDLPDPR